MCARWCHFLLPCPVFFVCLFAFLSWWGIRRASTPLPNLIRHHGSCLQTDRDFAQEKQTIVADAMVKMKAEFERRKKDIQIQMLMYVFAPVPGRAHATQAPCTPHPGHEFLYTTVQ